MSFYNIVVPAKAGIHLPQIASVPTVEILTGLAIGCWIPAFAGMTTMGGL